MLKTFEQFIFDTNNNSTFNIKSRSSFFAINESQESKSQSAAIKLVMNKFGWDYQKSDKFVREDLRNDIPSLSNEKIAKFTLGVTRMFVDGELNDARIISNLNSTLKLLSAHLGEYDRNLNGLSAEELISKFEKTRQNNIEHEKQEINRMKFGVSDYEIVRIDTFEDAKKYYTYTNPSSRWSITYVENMFDAYTCNGINQIYFCLKHGFEDIKPIVGENAPLDEYGLSMLSIIVNEKGELFYCTCRWNDDNGGDDIVMDAVEISKVVNVNFYETFKPNTKWKDMVNNAKNRLENGESPEDVFDFVDEFKEGYAKVELNEKWNFINKDGKIISDKWFDYAFNFRREGYAKVELNRKCNFINTDGKIISDKWFDNAYSFKEGYAGVELNRKLNFINTDGKIISDKWFDDVDDFKEGYAGVKLNKKWNFINTDCEYLSDEWFDDVDIFKDGYAGVKLNKKFNFINKNGEIMSDKWFDSSKEIKEYLDNVLKK